MSILAALESIENGETADLNAVAQAETATEVAEEVAEVAAWLALENTYMTGQSILLDGGL